MANSNEVRAFELQDLCRSQPFLQNITFHNHRRRIAGEWCGIRSLVDADISHCPARSTWVIHRAIMRITLCARFRLGLWAGVITSTELQ